MLFALHTGVVPPIFVPTLFALHTGVVPPIFVPTLCFEFIALRNIRVEEDLLSEGATVAMKQTSQPA